MAADNTVRVASPQGRKKGRRAQKAQTQVTSQDVGVPVDDQTGCREARNTNATKNCERRSDVPETGTARAVQGPVAERRSNTVLSGPTHQPAQKREPLVGFCCSRSEHEDTCVLWHGNKDGCKKCAARGGQ